MQRLTTDKFIEKAKVKHGDFYDYSLAVYSISHNPLKIICPEHGVFEQVANKHLCGKGCPNCGLVRRAKKRAKPLKDFLKEAKKIHGDKYCYRDSVLKGMLESIEIRCRKHGVFTQTAASHLRGHGCDACARELTGTHKRSEYTENCTKRHDGLSHLYLVKIFDDSEEFYKVGISVHDVKARFSKHKMPYQVKPVKVIKAEAGYVWDLEKRILSLVKGLSYKPKNKFNGHTECFSKIPKGLQKLLQSLAESEQIPLIA